MVEGSERCCHKHGLAESTKRQIAYFINDSEGERETLKMSSLSLPVDAWPPLLGSYMTQVQACV